MEILRSNYFFAVISYCECVTFRSDNGSRPLRRIHRCCCAIDTEREREREKERNKTSRSNIHKLWRASLLRSLCTAFVSFPSNIYISSRLSFYLSFFPSFLAVAETISTSAEREGKAAGKRERGGQYERQYPYYYYCYWYCSCEGHKEAEPNVASVFICDVGKNRGRREKDEVITQPQIADGSLLLLLVITHTTERRSRFRSSSFPVFALSLRLIRIDNFGRCFLLPGGLIDIRDRVPSNTQHQNGDDV